MKRFYPAIIDKDPDSDYGISFPDFPGCVSAGSTPEEAIVMGSEALSGHIAIMVADGDTIPEPSSLEKVKADEDMNVFLLTLVPAILPNRPKRINITIDESLLEEIDHIAPNRSAFLADAARAELARRAEA